MPFPQRIGPTELPTTIGTIFTVNRPLRLIFLSLTNRTAAQKLVTLSLVPQNGSPGNTNRLLDAVPIEANDMRTFQLDIPLSAGETIQAFSDVAGINLIGTVTERPGA